MKKNLHYLTLVLLIGLQACQSEKSTQSITTPTSKKDSSKTSRGETPEIVFVYSDSVLRNYELYKKSSKEFEKLTAQYDTDIKAKGSAFQNKVEGLQRTAGTMTINDLEQTKQRLAQEEQVILQQRETYAKLLNEEEAKMTEKLNQNIKDFMARFAKEKGYKMILGYAQGATAWYGDSTMDVTQQVIKGLNEEYKNQGPVNSTETPKKE